MHSNIKKHFKNSQFYKNYENIENILNYFKLIKTRQKQSKSRFKINQILFITKSINYDIKKNI